MSIVAASASSRSAGPWTCRRLPITTARPARGQSASSRTSASSNVSARSMARTISPTAIARRGWPSSAPARRVGRHRVKRLMREHGIQGAKRRGKPWRTTITDPAAHRAPDLVNRDFRADRPDELWVADFTYLRCWEGLVFFSFVIDVFSRRVVGRQFASHMPAANTRASRSARSSTTTGPRVDRDGRRRLRQRAGRELRRHVQNRADRRPRLANTIPARARDRAMGRLVQHQPPTPIARRHPARRIRTAARRPVRSHRTLAMKRGNH